MYNSTTTTNNPNWGGTPVYNYTVPYYCYRCFYHHPMGYDCTSGTFGLTAPSEVVKISDGGKTITVGKVVIQLDRCTVHSASLDHNGQSVVVVKADE